MKNDKFSIKNGDCCASMYVWRQFNKKLSLIDN